MNKRHLHHVWKKLRRIKPWYFLILTLIFFVVSIMSLRSNNEHMVKLRSAVYAADKNNGDTETALRNLQMYVTSHMNTDLSVGNDSVYPPIQLKYTYQRLVDAQSEQLSTTNLQLYTEAQQYCEKQDSTDFSGHNRVPCIEQYVQSHNAAALPTIPDALYKFDFVSPRWSPDLAGWSIVITIVSFILFVITFIVDRWFRRNVA